MDVKKGVRSRTFAPQTKSILLQHSNQCIEMKINLILACVWILIGCASCKHAQKSTATGISDAQHAVSTTSARDSTAAAPAKRSPTPYLVQVPIDDLPPATASRRAYFSTNWWNINAAVGNDDLLITNYRHKWMKFREDQTFDILIGDKVVDTGRWNYDENKDEIYLSCKDPYINNTWAVKTSGFRMIWVGNTSVNSSGYQLRVINTKEAKDP